MSSELSILLLEDDPSSIRLFTRKVQSAPVGIYVKDVRNKEAFLRELETPHFDCVVLDYTLPDINGIEAIRLVKEMSPETPVIIYTGSVGEEKAVECMKEGAAEFLLKTNSIRLVPAILSVVNQKHEREARLRAEEAQKQSEARFHALAETSAAAIFIYQGEKFTYVNSVAEQISGYTHNELMNMKFWEFAQPEHHEMMRKRGLARQSGEDMPSRFEYKIFTKDGKKLWLDFALSSIIYEGKPAVLGIALETTIQKKMEQQVSQSQKMESIGTLAGGIAHEFNNILNIVSGYASLVERHIDDPENLENDVKTILEASSRGTALIRQLVAFSRKSEVKNAQLDVNALVKELVSLLHATFPKTIEIISDIGDSVYLTKANQNQLNQALLNLALNARDAMPEGGTLRFTTGLIGCEELRPRIPNVQDGEYVHIAISDTGKGMDKKTKTKMFDPFFTTQQKETGTGLSLSIVYGILGNHNGFIDVESEVGKGTTMHIFLPILSSTASIPHIENNVRDIFGGQETILIVEDEFPLRRYFRTLLEEKGYKVLDACDGNEGVEVFGKNQSQIALVISDFDMPKLNGLGLLKKIVEIRPAIKVILASGFFDSDQQKEILQAGAQCILQKPYDEKEILIRVREILDSMN